ncbi:PfkB family carbohydrate kinase [Virgisporangium aurantiacum]|uniref:Ribokinase n=1 Tax=Virgisporangium aurantiacum TaxID=175570 RepID=A0A8J3Z144_9ACTN|nr:PfkB family carbohydrate kinase [Virgisporangium aurantiacum]GIJ55714.1 ribokinase [Virgisporangium aurantiacum]
MAGELVVFGSLNLDLVLPVGALPAPGQTVLGGDLRRYPGGKGANQAAAAAGLAGGRVRLVGRVGADAEGSFLLAEAAAAGVDVSGVLADAGATTGHALILVDGQGENIIAVAPGANARLDHTDAARATGPLGPGDTLICQLEVPVPAVAAAVLAARAAGALVVVNAAPAVSVPAALLADVDILVVNESEARAIGTADPAALAARTGCAVVVTLGGDGAAFAEPDGGRAGSAPSYPVDVVDTTGAGDVFVAGLAVARHRGADLAGAVAFAVAAGALAVTAPGARVAGLSAARVRRLMG